MAGRQRGIVVPITATDNTERAFQSVQAQVAELRARVASLQGQLAGGGGNPGALLGEGMRHAVPEIAAASGAVRELEGNLPIRAVERFLTTTLGLGPVLAAAFPLVGAIALGGIVYENIKRFGELYERAKTLGAVIAQAFDEAISKERQQADQIALTNAKLDEEIAKLEHKPADGLRTGAAEARVEFDKLDDSIRGALNTAKQLFDEKYKVGVFDRLTGTKSTDDIKDIAVGTQERVQGIRSEHGDAIRRAQDRGESPEHIAELQRLELAAIQDEYAKSDKALQAKLKDDLDKQYDARQLGGSGKEYDERIAAARGTLQLQDQQQRTLGEEYYEGQRKPVLEKDRAAASSDQSNRKAEEEARKEREAQDKLAAARRGFDDASAREQAAAVKASATEQLAALETVHKQLLVSDEDYYRQKAAIQNNALEAEVVAALLQQNDINSQIGRLKAQPLTGNDATERDAKVLDLRAKLLALDSEIARVTGQEARNREQAAASISELAQKRIADADRIAARLEQERGGSVTARQQQSRDQYDLERRQAVVEYGGEQNPAVQNLDAQQRIDQDSIAAQGAEQDFGAGDAERRTQRNELEAEYRRGLLSSAELQKQKIALDRQEADALELVLAKQEALAADGDLAAIDKVAELKERIAELKDPVNDVAAEVRGQLDSAFERVFENIDNGKKALKEFGKQIEGDVLKDLYKSAIQPGLQAGLGILIPNSRARQQPQIPGIPQAPGDGGFRPTFSSGLGSVLGGLFGGDAGKGSGQNFKVIVENRSSTPVAATNSSGSFDSDAKEFILHTVLEDAAGGGVISHLFK